MAQLTRRSVLRGSLGLAAGAALASPYVANAQAKTAQVWWAQGFVPEEDEIVKKLVVDYQKLTGNKLETSIVPFAPLRQKIISAITSGEVPDLCTVTPTEAACLQAWQGKLVDVTDVIEPHKAKM